MTTVAVWLLISISTGYYNGGTATVIATFATKEDCGSTRDSLQASVSSVAVARCVAATVVKP